LTQIKVKRKKHAMLAVQTTDCPCSQYAARPARAAFLRIRNCARLILAKPGPIMQKRRCGRAQIYLHPSPNYALFATKKEDWGFAMHRPAATMGQ
jgi:hypothetical protein